MIRVKRNDVMSYECQELQNAANDVDLTLEERGEAADQRERLADAKDAHAQYIIGTAYRNGGLLIPDTVKARKLLERAAAQEIDAAQYALGKLYLMGEGVQQGTDTAYQWFTKACCGGHTYAGMFMDRIERGEQRPPSVMLATTRLLYHMGNIFRDNAPIPAATGIQIDRKRLQELQRKRIASAASRTIMNLNRRDTRCSSIDSVNAKGGTKRVYFALLWTKKHSKSNSFLHRVMVCMLAAVESTVATGGKVPPAQRAFLFSSAQPLCNTRSGASSNRLLRCVRLLCVILPGSSHAAARGSAPRRIRPSCVPRWDCARRV